MQTLPPHTHHTPRTQVGFEELEKVALSAPDPGDAIASGRQELAEIYLDMHIK
jgi:hypothetical protein